MTTKIRRNKNISMNGKIIKKQRCGTYIFSYPHIDKAGRVLIRTVLVRKELRKLVVKRASKSKRALGTVGKKSHVGRWQGKRKEKNRKNEDKVIQKRNPRGRNLSVDLICILIWGLSMCAALLAPCIAVYSSVLVCLSMLLFLWPPVFPSSILLFLRSDLLQATVWSTINTSNVKCSKTIEWINRDNHFTLSNFGLYLTYPHFYSLYTLSTV